MKNYSLAAFICSLGLFRRERVDHKNSWGSLLCVFLYLTSTHTHSLAFDKNSTWNTCLPAYRLKRRETKEDTKSLKCHASIYNTKTLMFQVWTQCGCLQFCEMHNDQKCQKIFEISSSDEWRQLLLNLHKNRWYQKVLRLKGNLCFEWVMDFRIFGDEFKFLVLYLETK